MYFYNDAGSVNPPMVFLQAQNTYLLTLDGDMDFKPDAVRFMVDQMKANRKVASTCGRIHPIGSGTIIIVYNITVSDHCRTTV